MPQDIPEKELWNPSFSFSLHFTKFYGCFMEQRDNYLTESSVKWRITFIAQ